MPNPIRELALAVIRQAMIDYYRYSGDVKSNAELYLRGEGRELWIALGFEEEFLDDFLDNPNEVGYTQLAGRRPKRRG